MGSEVWGLRHRALQHHAVPEHAPFLGGLSDRIGRRPVLLITLVANSLGYLLLGFSEGIVLLFIARMISGMASGNISVGAGLPDRCDASRAPERAWDSDRRGLRARLHLRSAGRWTDRGHFGFAYVGWFAACLCLLNFLLACFILKESIPQKTPDAPLKLIPCPTTARAFRTGWCCGSSRQLPVRGRLLPVPGVLHAVLGEHFGLNEQQRGYAFAFLGISTAVVQGLLIRRLSARFGDERLLIAGNIGMAVILGPGPGATGPVPAAGAAADKP